MITPEPGPEELEAILVALDRMLAGRDPAPPAWWLGGLRESVDDRFDYEADDELPAGALNSRGATRA